MKVSSLLQDIEVYISYLQESSPAVLPGPAGSGVKRRIACPGFRLPRREGQSILVSDYEIWWL